MTGAEMRAARLKMGMAVVQFGIEVLNWEGGLNTLSRHIRRMEKADKVSERTAAKVRAALRNKRTSRNGRS